MVSKIVGLLKDIIFIISTSLVMYKTVLEIRKIKAPSTPTKTKRVHRKKFKDRK